MTEQTLYTEEQARQFARQQLEVILLNQINNMDVAIKHKMAESKSLPKNARKNAKKNTAYNGYLEALIMIRNGLAHDIVILEEAMDKAEERMNDEGV